MQIEFNGLALTHRINPRRKHSAIEIDCFGNVTLKTPRVSGAFVQKLLEEKFEWIVQTRKRCTQKEPVPGEEILYFGRLEKIEQIPKIALAIKRMRDKTPKKIQKAYDDFYKAEAKRYIPKRLRYYANKMELEYKEVRFRKMKRRWGSCSRDAVLTFNTRLMQKSHRFIDEVVVHELAHLVHFNHSKAFYKLIDRYLEDR